MSYNTNSTNNYENNKPPLIIVIFVMVVGIALACVGIVQRLEMKSKAKYFATTEGVIVGYEGSSKGSTSAAVYEYEVYGFTYTKTESVSTAGKQEIGKKITVRYNPADPIDAFTDSPANTSLLFTTIGVFFFVVGLILLLQAVEIFEKNISDFITAILISGIFIGFPIVFITAIPGLPIIVMAILLILMAAGLIIIVSLIYRTFIKKDISDSQPFIQHVDSIYDTPYGEKVEQLREKAESFKKYYVIASVIVAIILFIFVAIQLPSRIKTAKESKTQMNQGLKKEISDEMIADFCGVDQAPKYIVYKCEIIDRQEDTYFIKEVAGLPMAVLSDEEFEVGETIYWVEIPGHGRILYDKDEYTYNGSNTPENSDRYNSDGKCILTDELIKDYCGGEPTSITEVIFSYNDQKEFFFVDANGTEYLYIVPNEYLGYYLGIKEGAVYYYVVVNNIEYFFSGELYTCSK